MQAVSVKACTCSAPNPAVLLPPAIAAVQLVMQPTNNGAWLPLFADEL